MSLPAKAEMTTPFLDYIKDGKQYSISDVVDHLAEHFNLTTAELSIVRPNSKTPKFKNTVHWHRFDMKDSGLISAPKYGYVQITQKGLTLLQSSQPKTIIIKEMPMPMDAVLPKPSILEQIVSFVRGFVGRVKEAI